MAVVSALSRSAVAFVSLVIVKHAAPLHFVERHSVLAPVFEFHARLLLCRAAALASNAAHDRSNFFLARSTFLYFSRVMSYRCVE